MRMRKSIEELESYIMLLDEFAAGGKKDNKRSRRIRRRGKEQIGFINALRSYYMLVNEMGAGGKKNSSIKNCKKWL